MTGATITLSDGRRLGYAEFGDPRGIPLLHFHGFPGSRLEAACAHAAGVELGVRLIGVDRPGFGLSDVQPGRTIVDWPDDVVELARALGLDRFAVVGVSGGAPYALACAWRIAERLSAVGILGGLGPMDRPGATRGMLPLSRLALLLSRRAPLLLHATYRPLAAVVARRPEHLLARVARLTAPPDAAAIGMPGFRAMLARSFREAFRAGTGGPVQDLVLYSHPWGFSLREIAVEVDLWHGEQDVVVPPSVGREVAAALPRCRAHFLQGEGHFSIAANRVREMLETLRERSTRGRR